MTDRDGEGHARPGPTKPSPKPPGLSSVLQRNIATLSERRKSEAENASFEDRLAQRITQFAGSILFVYIHLALFGFWIIANLGWIPGVPVWDPSFVILAMWASVEAIFLSTFVLISQNRNQATADKRADLDLQISLLVEHEITKLTALAASIAERLGVQPEAENELEEIKQDVAPEVVLDEIESNSPAAT